MKPNPSLERTVRQLNNYMRSLAAIAVAFSFCTAVQGAPTPPTVRAEIDALLAKLKSSGCEFSRNGSWHSAADAKTHLLRKLEYLEKKTTLPNAEQFIELAGTSSSSSGQAYQVKCSGGSAVPSATWLTKELAVVRAAAGQSASAPK